MSIVETLLSPIVGGGITGLAGVIVQKVADFKTKQLDIQLSREKSAHEIELRKVDAEIMEKEYAARTKMAEIEYAGKESVEDSKAFAASFNDSLRFSDKVKPTVGQGWMLVLLDMFRGIVRPALTVYLCFISTAIYFETKNLIPISQISVEQSIALNQEVINTMLFLTSTCITWWFGSRFKSKS